LACSANALAHPANQLNRLLPDDVPIKDELTPWMAVLIGRAQ